MDPKNRLCISLTKRLIQDHSSHGASKEPDNPRLVWISQQLSVALNHAQSTAMILQGGYSLQAGHMFDELLSVIKIFFFFMLASEVVLLISRNISDQDRGPT